MNPPEEEKKDPVWELLKEASPPEVSPFFARNVLREVRQFEDVRRDRSPLPRFLDWLAQPIFARAALATMIALAVVAFIAFQSGDSPEEGSPPGTVVNVTPLTDDYDPAQEIENLDYLGELMAVTDPAMLDDSALADLLF